MRWSLLISSVPCLGVLLTDPEPLTEYYARTLKNYTPLTWKSINSENAAKMLRVSGLTDAEFRNLVRLGYPFIVDDCAPKAELSELPCSEYGRRWPKEHMRAEYTPNQEHIYLKDSTWYTVQKPTAKASKHISRGKPLSGPYIWHVKDETDDKSVKPTIQKLFPVPYFLNRTALNTQEAKDSFEFWFVLENGGSQAHADAYCETTISLQLRGRKTWRLGAFPNISNAFQPYSFHDAEIYRQDKFWQPEHEELVTEGQCVVFPMGYIHETYIFEGDGGNDGCSVAATFQFQDPQPVFQWRNFLTRWGLSHYARDEPCIERMEPYVFLGKRIASGKSEEATRLNAQKAFVVVDADGDGFITPRELESQYASYRTGFPWTEIRSRDVLRTAMQEKAAFIVEDTMLYHDVDGDGVVSAAEFEESVLKFMAMRSRLRYIKKTGDVSKLFKREQTWIRNHLCTSDDCHYLSQLETDYRKRTGRAPGNEL